MQMLEGIMWVILTVYFEAGGESAEGQRNVTKVILNRAEKKRWPLRNIVFARKQFSCWNNGLDDPKVWVKYHQQLADVSENVFEAVREWTRGDKLNGATHYYAIEGMVGKVPPYWASSASMKFITEVGGHRFFKEG